jgi:hypothetical protein
MKWPQPHSPGRARRARWQWRRRPAADSADPALRLAREWLLARGARLLTAAPDVIAGKLPDGALERYTASAQHARAEPALVSLAPSAPGRQSLVAAVTQRARGLVLRLPASGMTPERLARDAFAAPASACERCAHGADGAAPLCAACPLLAGRFIVLGGVAALRSATIEHRRDDRAIEYTFELTTSTYLGRRQELLRLAVDAATGDPVPALPEALMRQAQGMPGAEAASEPDPQLLTYAEARLEPISAAAGRLARAQVLPAYERRQKDVAALYSSLLVEAPDQGAAALAEREQALLRLAEAHAVEVSARLINAATILSPVAEVRVKFAGGGATTVAVDRGRDTVAPPRCAACDAAWRVGARCAGGHVTCLSCQRQCAHCGVRRCALCTTPALAPCPKCGQLACVRRARATERGRHRAVAPSRDATPASPASLPLDAPSGPEDLRLADLDAMSPATWRACMAWLLAGAGYAVERAIAEAESATDPHAMTALVYRRVSDRAATLPASDALAGLSAPLVVAVGFRPRAPSVLGDDAIARAWRLAARVGGATPLLLTTAYAAPTPPRRASRTAPPRILARGDLARLLTDRTAAYQQEQAIAAQAMDARASQAAAVRAVIIQGCAAAATRLSGTHIPQARGFTEQDATAQMDSLTAVARVARQSLTALETLADEWEGLSSATPARDDTLAITATPAQLEQLQQRADHLTDVLAREVAAIARAPALDDQVRDAWREAVVEELRLRCEALAARCEALDPERWRSFAAARNQEAAQRSVRAASASQRAAIRAARLQGEWEAQAASGARERRSRTGQEA